MLPLHDPDIERRRFPTLTIGLIAVNVSVFLYQLSLDPIESFAFVYKFGAIPAEVIGNSPVVAIPIQIGAIRLSIDVASPIPDWGTMFTSMFIHGGFMHLGGNMLYLWVFGKSVEDRFGHLAFMVLFVAAGLVGVIGHAVVDASSTTPMVGASGAIAGVLGAYIVLYPFSMVNTLITTFLITVVRIPAVVLLGIWGVLQLFNGLGSIGPEVANTGVAYFAHVGGFVFGVAVAATYQTAHHGRGGLSAIRTRARAVGKTLGASLTGEKTSSSRTWSSVACPTCGGNKLDFLDPPIRRWVCRRCGSSFS